MNDVRLQDSEDPICFVVQATSPRVSRYNGWLTERNGVLRVMDNWSWEETYVAGTVLYGMQEEEHRCAFFWNTDRVLLIASLRPAAQMRPNLSGEGSQLNVMRPYHRCYCLQGVLCSRLFGQ